MRICTYEATHSHSRPHAYCFFFFRFGLVEPYISKYRVWCMYICTRFMGTYSKNRELACIQKIESTYFNSNDTNSNVTEHPFDPLTYTKMICCHFLLAKILCHWCDERKRLVNTPTVPCHHHSMNDSFNQCALLM